MGHPRHIAVQPLIIGAVEPLGDQRGLTPDQVAKNIYLHDAALYGEREGRAEGRADARREGLLMSMFAAVLSGLIGYQIGSGGSRNSRKRK